MMVKINLGSIRNRFKIVLAEKEVKDGRRYSYRDIQEITGVAASTLTDWAQGKARFIAVDTLAALCHFLECRPADLLEYLPPEDLPE
jgi:putative transcriptional regulator